MKRILLFLTLALLLCACSSAGKGANTPEKAVETYIRAIYSYDAEKALACWPDFYIESMMTDYGVSTESALKRAMEEEVKGRTKRDYALLKTEADDGYYTADDLERFKTQLEQEFSLTEKQLAKITKLCRVNITVRIGGEETTDGVLCFRYDGNWYVID